MSNLIDWAVAVGGAVGGIIRWVIKPTRPLWEAMISAAVGVALALYFTPIVWPISLDLLEKFFPDRAFNERSVIVATGALLGFMGRDLLEALLDFLRGWFRKHQ